MKKYKYNMKAITKGGEVFEVVAVKDEDGFIQARYTDSKGNWFREYSTLDRFKSYLKLIKISNIISLNEAKIF